MFGGKSSTKQNATQITATASGYGVSGGGPAFGSKIFQPGSNDWKKPAIYAGLILTLVFLWMKRRKGKRG
jgi:hypothetical protein